MLTRDFVLAGKAIFTVSNPQGVHYTYKITHKEASENYGEMYFVSLLTGPCNTSDYTYLGILNAESGGVRLTRKSKYAIDSVPVRVVNWALGLVWAGKELPAGYSLQHEGRCGRCGRTLTVPESIESGIGPECAKMMSC